MSIIPTKEARGIIVDLFAGGGGASVGIEAGSGRHVDIALNHDPVALAVHEANHPGTVHLKADIWKADPRAACAGQPVDLLWASPDCTHFSAAKGGQPRKQNIRSLAWAVVRWADAVRPRLIIIENVKEFQGWGPLDDEGFPIIARMGETFRRWRRRLEQLGYTVDLRILDASLYGAPTKRRRLFLVARCDMQPIRWPAPTHGPGLQPLRTAAECIDWSIDCPSIFLSHEEGRALGVKRPLADPTLTRIAFGVMRHAVESADPFIVEVAHGKTDHRTSSIHAPLTTITATQRTKALVMVNTRNGERHGRHGEQEPRAFDVREPFRTITAQGSQGAVVAAFLARHINPGDKSRVDAGTSLHAPMPTAMARDQKSLVEVQLSKHDRESAERTTAFLLSYYSGGGRQGASTSPVNAPMPTITTRDRFGLVCVRGWPIIDIGMRMLQPHELLRGQFGRFAESYDISAATSQEDKVRLIGNSVCPEVAEAVVRANLTPNMDLYGQGDLFTGLAAA